MFAVVIVTTLAPDRIGRTAAARGWSEAHPAVNVEGLARDVVGVG
jgi:hypothetical protein